MLVGTENSETSNFPPRKLWTRAECEVMGRLGIVDLEQHELIGGRLIVKAGKQGPEMRAIASIVSWLRSINGETFVVQGPSIFVHPEDSPTNEPEPDAVVLNRSLLEMDRLPGPEELLLVAEVSGVFLGFDLKVKGELYARAGIAEYWILDLNERRVIVHRRPEGGRYMERWAYLEDEMVSTLGAPEVCIRVGDLF